MCIFCPINGLQHRFYLKHRRYIIRKRKSNHKAQIMLASQDTGLKESSVQLPTPFRTRNLLTQDGRTREAREDLPAYFSGP
jgi:hypothetical protein